MASIHRQANSRNWRAAFTGTDGRKVFRSTGTSDRSKALAIALEYEAAAREGRQGRLTEARVRAVFADLFRRVNRDKLPTSTTRAFLASWLKAKSLEVSEASVAAYGQTCKQLEDYLGAKADNPVDAVTLHDATGFRDAMAERVSPVTANKQLKNARIIWNDAIREQLAADNPFAKVRALKAKAATRRAFTLDELRTLLSVASGDWRGMILCGVYLGQRLGDLANLTWHNVDLMRGEVSIVTGKTDRPMHIPMAEPLRAYFMSRTAPDDPGAPVFPDLHGLKTETLSNHFNKIAVAAGLARTAPDHQGTGKGRGARRKSRGMSFHCLRHTATSLLKNAGVSDVVARELIGHDSEAVSRLYTHIEGSTLRKAMESMPDVTVNKKG